MTNYFKDCQSYDEAKITYRNLALLMHPDRGGQTAKFQELQHQYENFVPAVLRYPNEDQHQNPAEFMEIINNLVNIPGIVIELIGSWIWVSGNTKPVSSLIKDAVSNQDVYICSWNRKRAVWQIHRKGYKRRSDKDISKDEIVNKYGSTNYNYQSSTPAIA